MKDDFISISLGNMTLPEQVNSLLYFHNLSVAINDYTSYR